MRRRLSSPPPPPQPSPPLRPAAVGSAAQAARASLAAAAAASAAAATSFSSDLDNESPTNYAAASFARRVAAGRVLPVLTPAATPGSPASPASPSSPATPKQLSSASSSSPLPPVPLTVTTPPPPAASSAVSLSRAPASTSRPLGFFLHSGHSPENNRPHHHLLREFAHPPPVDTSFTPSRAATRSTRPPSIASGESAFLSALEALPPQSPLSFAARGAASGYLSSDSHDYINSQAYHDYDNDYGYDGLADYDTPSSAFFEIPFSAPSSELAADEAYQDTPPLSASLFDHHRPETPLAPIVSRSLGRRALEFLQQTAVAPNGMPKFELENELGYYDSDHRHAHGHAASDGSSDLLALHKRSLSSSNLAYRPENMAWDRGRRKSHDDFTNAGISRKFVINVEETQRQILEQEDTDGDCQITVQDGGPKIFKVGTANSNGFHKFEIRGTYMLSNLLQELALAKDHGRKYITIDESRLNENPVDRMHRLIKYHFWDGLTRRIDAEGLEVICADPKNRQKDQQYRIYVPYHDDFALEYYKKVQAERAHLNLDVVQLPDTITPEYVKSLNKQPGLLSLALRRRVDEFGNEKVSGAPFVVPGGRFNEMYGWDSYFEALGLLVDGRIALAQGMVENFMYEIEHYGKILNANRSYYLTRSQPPFLTDMLIQVYRAFVRSDGEAQTQEEQGHAPPRRKWAPGELKVWLARGIRAALKELFGVWLCSPRLDANTGLSKYHPEGIGIPPETESTHFHHVLEPYATAHGMTVSEFEAAYAKNEVRVPELDEYFIHDRAVRESGHDTTYRFDGICANLATIDLNSLLYKYESDLFKMIMDEFGGSFRVRIRRGPNDENLRAFQQWIESLLDGGVSGTLGENGGWDSSWGKGIVVFDHELDDEYGNLPERLESTSFSGIPSFTRPAPNSSLFSVVLPASLFFSLSKRRRALVQRYLWSEEDRLFYDYDCRMRRRIEYRSVTALWALWSGLATREQADLLVPRCLELFEVVGGLVSGTEESRGHISLARPNRQWDFPYGWAPHQILAWEGLEKYGFPAEARRLVYRWLYTIVKSFVDFNGVVPEKFDVVGMTHRVQVEYGNVGTDFKFVVREGFGWMNASFQVGLVYLTNHMRRALGTLTHPDQLFRVLQHDKKPTPVAAGPTPGFAQSALAGITAVAPAVAVA